MRVPVETRPFEIMSCGAVAANTANSVTVDLGIWTQDSKTCNGRDGTWSLLVGKKGESCLFAFWEIGPI